MFAVLGVVEIPAVHSLRAARRRLGRPPAPAAGADRRATSARAVLLALVPILWASGHLHDVAPAPAAVRRSASSPSSSTSPTSRTCRRCRARAPRRRQLEAQLTSSVCRGRGAGVCRGADRGGDRAVRDRRGRDQLRRLGRVHAPHAPPRERPAARAGRSAAEHVAPGQGRASTGWCATRGCARSQPARGRRTSSRRWPTRSSSTTWCGASHLSALEIGAVFAVGSGGSIAAALAANRLNGWIGVGPTIVWTIGASCVAGFAYPLAPRSFPLPVLVLGSALFGFGAVAYNIRRSACARRSPRAVAGADERGHALHRLGDDPARHAARRRDRDLVEPPRRALGRRVRRTRRRSCRWRSRRYARSGRSRSPSSSSRRPSSPAASSRGHRCRGRPPRTRSRRRASHRRAPWPSTVSGDAGTAGDGGVAAPVERPGLAFPVARAGPAHIATLKTFDPPLTRSRGGASAAPSGAASGCSSRPTTASWCCSST